jgi:S1-C subfamily serine protease
MNLLTWPRTVIAVVGIALAAGCVQPPPYSADQRAQSFKELANDRVGAETLEQHLFARDAIVLPNAMVTEFEPDGKLVVAKSSLKFEFGSAAAIDRRGYFITARHVVADGTTLNIFWHDGGQIEAPTWHHAVARLVWRSPLGDKMDLAILCVPIPLRSAFEWARAVQPGEQVAASGCGRSPAEMFRFNLAGVGGKVSAVVGHDDDRPRWSEVIHDAPLYFGDSGGPLVNLRGELLGFNTGVGADIHFMPATTTFFGRATRPDVDWLRRIIAFDFVRHTSAEIR